MVPNSPCSCRDSICHYNKDKTRALPSSLPRSNESTKSTMGVTNIGLRV